MVQDEHDPACPSDATRDFVGAVAHAKLLLARRGDLAAGAPGGVPGHRRASRRPTIAHPAAADVADLPLVEVPASGAPTGTLAVILSGDGGWASIDRDIGEQLAARGIGVVGLNSLRYFWTRRTPDGAAADLARILRHYVAAWHARRVLLLGYSRGADVLPFMANRLPPDAARARRAGGAPRTGARAWTSSSTSPTGWPTLRARARSRCVRRSRSCAARRSSASTGSDESDSLCPTLDAELATLMPQDGGHHFGGDYDAIVARILARAGVASPPPAP